VSEPNAPCQGQRRRRAWHVDRTNIINADDRQNAGVATAIHQARTGAPRAVRRQHSRPAPARARRTIEPSSTGERSSIHRVHGEAANTPRHWLPSVHSSSPAQARSPDPRDRSTIRLRSMVAPRSSEQAGASAPSKRRGSPPMRGARIPTQSAASCRHPRQARSSAQCQGRTRKVRPALPAQG